MPERDSPSSLGYFKTQVAMYTGSSVVTKSSKVSMSNVRRQAAPSPAWHCSPGCADPMRPEWGDNKLPLQGASGESYCVGKSYRMSSENSQQDLRTSVTALGLRRGANGVLMREPRTPLPLLPTSLTRPVFSSHSPGTLRPQCLSATSLPSIRWATVTTARSPSPSAFTTWPPAMSTSLATCYGATNTGTWPTN